MTTRSADDLLDDLERLAQPDRVQLAVFTLDGALVRMVPRQGGLFQSLRLTDAGLFSWLNEADAAEVRALSPAQTLEREVPSGAAPSFGPRVRVTVLRRQDDYLLLGTPGSGVDDLVMSRMTHLNNETLNLYRELARQKADLEEAMGHIRVLRGLLPICSKCKKIRNDEGAWDDLESYIHDHSEAEFSHGLCPTCLQSLYPDDC